jgi:hypothetical protein
VNVCTHEWRLIDERPELRAATALEEAAHVERLKGLAPTSKLLRVRSGLTLRRWYCTRCRLIDEVAS